ncbi:MAG: toll/interleukin-1 receptor domain-containing protein, partial [Hyphomicrobium sp.]
MSAASTTPRIFLSYSRRDAAYAAELRARIEADGLLLWQDITHMEGGNAGGWWDQIRERLEQHSTEHMVLLVSSDSLASGIVADEWRVARRHGVEVHLVTVSGKLGPREFGEMP